MLLEDLKRVEAFLESSLPMTVRTTASVIEDIILQQLPEKVRPDLKIAIDTDPYFLKCRIAFGKPGRDTYVTTVDPQDLRLSKEAIGYVCTFLG